MMHAIWFDVSFAMIGVGALLAWLACAVGRSDFPRERWTYSSDAESKDKGHD